MSTVKSILPKTKDDGYFMREAIKEAKKASLCGEVPIGAVIVDKGKIFARGHNKRISKNSSIAHAEIETIQKASKKLGDWRLKDMILYVTVEPCLMCAGAIIHSRIGRIVYGCNEPKMGAVRSQYKVLNNTNAHHKVDVTPNILEEECKDLLSKFFKDKRKRGQLIS